VSLPWLITSLLAGSEDSGDIVVLPENKSWHPHISGYAGVGLKKL
jgi:hypothetical protein